MTLSTKKQESFEYKAEMKQLLHLIIHSLYTHKEVFLRELISNASDALNKARVHELTNQPTLDKGSNLQIKIEVDNKKKVFSIEDTGVGMTRDELIENIGTIARSGTLEFAKKLKDVDKEKVDGLIGQFGVGFYSIFMVTDEVAIETRHINPDSKAYRWVSKGESSFTIEETERQERGTKITFKLKKDAEEFAEDFTIKDIVAKYSNFADFPIKLGEEQINKVNAVWRKSQKDVTQDELDEFYKYLTNDHGGLLSHLHLSIESAAVNFKALLFIPKKAPHDLFQLQNEDKGLHLYTNKVLIHSNFKELLPEYLRFLKGVVDTDDLPLNVSREVAQSSPLTTKIQDIVVKRVLNFLEDLSKKESEKYLEFYKSFGPLFKTGLNTDYTNRDRLINLLRFESTKQTDKEKLISLKDYISRMKPDQEEIYYLTGSSREALEKNPNLEYFTKNDIEVLLISEPVDVFVVPTITEYEKKPLKSIDKDDINIKDDEKSSDNKLSESLVGLFKEVLKDRVKDVTLSKRLVDSPVTLVKDKEAMDPQMERMMQMMGNQVPKSKKILEVNVDHPLLSNLSKRYLANDKDPLLETCILQLYRSAAFVDGDIASDEAFDYIKRMNEIMQIATDTSS